MEITIIDYGVGNLRSLQRAFEAVDTTVTITDKPTEIATAEALVLPGVGAFDACVRNLEPFREVLIEAAEDTPLLGICVGFQLLFTGSTEGISNGETTAGLDLLSGHVHRLPSAKVKVPHVGWNNLDIKGSHPIVDGIKDGDYAYFVHSYATEVAGHTAASCEYGFEFATIASNEQGNVMGTQFHPEKSADLGLRVLHNFVTFAEGYQDDRPPVS